MQRIRNDGLVLSDPVIIRQLLIDLAESGAMLAVEGPELGPYQTLRIGEVRDKYISVQTNCEPETSLELPMSSWNLSVALVGAELKMTTAALAQTDSTTFGLCIPDEITTCEARRHYRVRLSKKERFWVALVKSNETIQAEVLDLSFGGARLLLPTDRHTSLTEDSEFNLSGRQQGVLFSERARVCWRREDEIGILLTENEGQEPLDKRPWSNLVRRIAYDQFMNR